MNVWPPKPGFTDITRTRSRSSFTHSSEAGVVAGFSAAPAFTGPPRLPASSRIEVSVRCRCGHASTCTVSMSAPRSANSARNFSGSTIIRCRSSGSRVRLRIASRTGKPMVMFGTKRPSITSMWIWSAPAASTRAISSARTPKSADRIEGAILTAILISRAAQPDGREAVGSVTIGPRAQKAVGVQRQREVGRPLEAPGRLRAEKRGDHRLVLLGLRRARRVHQAPAGLHEGGRGGQDLALARGAGGDVLGPPPPLHVRIAAQHAEVRAGRVHQD